MKNLNKLALAALMTTTLLADGHESSSDAHAQTNHGGFSFHVGLQGGGGQSRVRTRVVDENKNEYISEHLSVAGGEGGAFISAGYTSKRNVFIGVSAYGVGSNFNGNQKIDEASDYLFKLKRNSAFGADMELGISFANYIPYAKIGYAAENFKIAYGNTTTNVYRTKSKMFQGVSAGLGVHFQLTQKVWGTVEGSHSFMKKVKFAQFDTVDDVHVKPSTTRILFKVSYKFK